MRQSLTPPQPNVPWWYSFWKFSRPHTIIGTTLSVFGLYGIAAGVRGAVVEDIWLVMLAWIACLCGNIYIVGLNQLKDIEIDKINKPHLPVAAGEFSPQQGWWIVGVTGLLAIALASSQGIWLLATVGVSLAIGTAYSLPPIRLKRFPVWASVCIFTVRGAVVNLGLFLHFYRGLPVLPVVWALTGFVLVYTFAIAIFKDIPDMEGDARYQISTFTLRLGAIAVFRLAWGAIAACYLGAIVAALLLPLAVQVSFFVVSHGVAFALFWWRSTQVSLKEKSEVASFYQFIWKLFYLEYLLFPIACLL